MCKLRGLFKGAAALVFCLPLFAFVIFGSAHLNASPAPQFVRVGLESQFHEQAQISVPSTDIVVGQLVGGHFQASGTLTGAGGFVARPDNSYYISLHYTFIDLTQAQAAAALHAGAVPAFLDSGFWGLYMPAVDGQPGDVVRPSSSRVSLSSGGQVVLISDNVNINLQIQGAQGITSLGQRQYRGVIELARFGGNLLTAVNVVDLEEYLWSVVPSEMPAGWHPEALKAQAVAARTYTVFRIGSLAHRGYDLCDTQFSQVYTGVGNEHPNTTAAVNATRGIMIFYNGLPIEAVYFSSSGGFTDNSENVWVAAVPYLRAVAEIHEPDARQWTRTVTLTQLNGILAANDINIGNATGLQLGKSANGRVQELTITGTTGQHTIRNEAARRFFSPSLYSRNFTISGGMSVHGAPGAHQAPPLRAYLQTSTGLSDASLAGLQVQGQFGRTSLGQEGISVQSASRVVNLLAVTPTPNLPDLPYQPNLPDRPQISNAIVSSTVSTDYTIQLVGRGWGHGVGMSQHGAHGMAQMGHNFRQILQHYYTGVEIH
ncbi:MAG: SpoIID/LytB domain-containing protein [Clostridiales bacterium]|jgi:stage II sporulation protein D|nr:SpoIID/LytB domain-containing protein [Clostridiales bacterium]